MGCGQSRFGDSYTNGENCGARPVRNSLRRASQDAYNMRRIRKVTRVEFDNGLWLFLAAIYKALRQIVSILHWERDCKLSENSNGSSVAMRSERDFEVSTSRVLKNLD